MTIVVPGTGERFTAEFIEDGQGVLRVICPYVFERFDGKVIKSFRKAWLAACRAAGCPGRIPHDFRRTAVRNLIRAGIPETVAMSMTGHKTRSVFMRYDIVSEGDLDSAAQKLNAAMTGTKTGTVVEKCGPERQVNGRRNYFQARQLAHPFGPLAQW